MRTKDFIFYRRATKFIVIMAFTKTLYQCTFLLLILFNLIGQISTHLTPAYLHDKTISPPSTNHSTWMSQINDNHLLTILSLPGTHDSMAFYGGDITHTQSLSLSLQLTAGIRVFDIRCRHIQDRFAIHHGSVFQHAWFNNALDEFTKFLIQFPTEIIFVRVSKTYKEFNNTRTFTDTFIWYEQLPEYKGYFWYPSEATAAAGTTDHGKLAVGSLRGKIVIIDNFSNSPSPFGLDYNTNFIIQDSYILRTNWDLYSKWEKVKAQLIAANAPPFSERDPTKLYMNYLSGSTGSFPYFVVSGHITHGTSAPRLATGLTTIPKWKYKWPDFPRTDCFLGICSILFEGTNILTWDYILDNKKCLNYIGIIMTDFPGVGLIESIIQVNFNKNNSINNTKIDSDIYYNSCPSSAEEVTKKKCYKAAKMSWNRPVSNIFCIIINLDFMCCTVIIFSLIVIILVILYALRIKKGLIKFKPWSW